MSGSWSTLTTVGRPGERGGDERVVPPSPHESSDEEVLDLVTAAARALADREADVVGQITELLRTIDALDGEDRMVELLEASVAGNVNTILQLFTHRIAVDQLQPTTAAVAYAAHLAERGVAVHALVRAYNMGQQELVQQLYDQLASRTLEAGRRTAAMRHVSAVLHRYVDWIVRYLIDVYESERARWQEAGPSVHTALVLAVLAGERGASASLAAATGYDLEQRHVALLAWAAPEDEVDDLAAVEAAVRELTHGIGGDERRPLVAAADRSTLWAWLPWDDRHGPISTQLLTAAIDDPRVNVSHGLPAEGEQGFRSSHEQAVAVHRLALTAAARPRVLGYADEGVAAVAGLARDLPAARTWVGSVLGGLASSDDDVARLRETVAVHLRSGASATRTAAALHLHRNSVRYRLDQATRLRGTSLDQGVVDLAVALRACELLGDSVLQD